MPATSKAQQALMAIAEHSPEKLYGRNKGVAKMSQSQLHDFAATKRKGLPEHVPHLEDGMTNTGYQQSEKFGRGSSWMERGRAMADGKAPEKWAGKAFAKNEGGLHRATGTPEGKPIPVYRVKRAAASGTPHEKKMAQAAININPRRYGA